MRSFDFSSWQGIATTVLGMLMFALFAVGIRVLMMLTIQQRQQRMNRQINERLKTLISAYRTLGGSFTGELTVSPAHLRELAAQAEGEAPAGTPPSDRPRRIRDAVEAALSDILLLGTEDQVRLAAQAAADMAAGRPIQTAELVIALRNYIRLALDLDAIPDTVAIPLQGPTRPQSGGGRSTGKAEAGRDRAGGGGSGGGGGMGMGLGLAGGRSGDSDPT
ncbi:hypothetical protein [Pseudogemmobacter blasticus]|uniref:Uncharacterized protein n=1 Tax=Fuscovulum blasticum DSM 2131 TaxID=1188250 RepID=A0A2T4JEF0_FUSBL|nr:hypothetical protein [Fuscovulum blasticum]PTE16295.1 hypothetical protein C5F44_00035 [Fuscovulum blasticum DSM 2131]